MSNRIIRVLILACLALTWAKFTVADQRQLSQAIDAEIDSVLREKGIAPADQASDTVLLRRIYLDVLGRIPTAEETKVYLEEADNQKASRLIDRLLKHEEFPVYWSFVLDEWLSGDVRERDYGQQEFLAYLEKAISENRGWDRIARELLLPTADDEVELGAAYFLSARLRKGDNQEKIDSMTTTVASVFFGVQLQCAKCHDHPYVEDWQQDHYYGLSAFLGRTQETKFKNRPFVKERAEGDVTFVTTSQKEKTAQLMFLNGHVVDEPELPKDQAKRYIKGKDGKPDEPKFSRRQALVEYALNDDTPYFKRAMVNRMWKHLMGRGLVEPVDQIHDANPATHPALLKMLADDFAEHGYDLKRLMSAILHSNAYQRSSAYTASGEPPKSSTYAAAILKPLSPDQLVTSISLATGQYDQLAEKYDREKEKRKLDTVTPAAMRRLMRQERDYKTFAEQFVHRGEYFEANATQALFLSYNSLLSKQLEPRSNNFVERLSKLDDQQAVETAFLTVLSRMPSDEEQQVAAELLAKDDQAQGHLVWALLCSAEFRFNH